LEIVPTKEINALQIERRRVVTKVSRLVRDSDFRRKVTIAYDRECCVTGLQLRLIDAAHYGIPEPFVYRETERGKIYHGDSLGLLHKTLEPDSVDLIMTSPPRSGW